MDSISKMMTRENAYIALGGLAIGFIGGKLVEWYAPKGYADQIKKLFWATTAVTTIYFFVNGLPNMDGLKERLKIGKPTGENQNLPNPNATPPSSDPNLDPQTPPNLEPSIDPQTQPNSDPNLDPQTPPNLEPSIDPQTPPNLEPSLDPQTPPNSDLTPPESK